jgi:hypothetical protein
MYMYIYMYVYLYVCFFGITVSFVPEPKPTDQWSVGDNLMLPSRRSCGRYACPHTIFFIFYDYINMFSHVAVGVAEGLRAVSGELPLGFDDMHCSPMFIRSLAALGIMAPVRIF